MVIVEIYKKKVYSRCFFAFKWQIHPREIIYEGKSATRTEMPKWTQLLFSVVKVPLQVTERRSYCFAFSRTGHGGVPRYQMWSRRASHLPRAVWIQMCETESPQQ